MIPYTFHPLGESGLLITFSHHDPSQLLSHIHFITDLILQQKVPGIKDIVPAFQTIAIYYDNHLYSYEQLQNHLTSFLQMEIKVHPRMRRHIEIPVCYDEAVALDIKEVADLHSLTVEDVIHIHTGTIYTVAFIGFLPGFPYLTGLDKKLITPRKSTPRTHVSMGAVGIGGSHTGIYPLSSPGGWNIIGQTNARLFTPGRDKPFLLQPGDSVTFRSITFDELGELYETN